MKHSTFYIDEHDTKFPLTVEFLGLKLKIKKVPFQWI